MISQSIYSINIDDFSILISISQGFNKNNKAVEIRNPTVPAIRKSERNPLCFFSSFLKKGKSLIVTPLIPNVPN